ncbi:hypothetical protein J6590_028452 [Homalodisca vitripennis]|nr:hypothetical protein J6590_028452 [Homalodisca vitripennis]
MVRQLEDYLSLRKSLTPSAIVWNMTGGFNRPRKDKGLCHNQLIDYKEWRLLE